MCSVPWSHVTMKWMTGFLLHDAIGGRIARGGGEQVKLCTDELPLRRQIVGCVHH